MPEGKKRIVRRGYDAIAGSYLAARTDIYTHDVELLQELIQRLPEGATILDAGYGAGVPITSTLSQIF